MDLFAIVFVVFIAFAVLGIFGTTAAFVLMTLRSMWAHKAALDSIKAASVAPARVAYARKNRSANEVERLVQKHLSINDNGEYVLSPGFFDELDSLDNSLDNR